VAAFTGDPRDYVVRPTDLDDFLEQAQLLKWTFARTMASTPHSYIVRDKQLSSEDYRRAFGAVNTFGEPAKFYDRTSIYLQRDGLRWWNMTRHEYESIILNHATDGKDYGVQDAPSTRTQWGWSPYDAIGVYYDNVHDERTAAEQVALWKTCDAALNSGKPKTLDLGAGTGGTLDARISGASDTTVVDVSQGMLNMLVMKYPKIFAVIPASVEEFLSWEVGSHYDLSIASFGAASYLSPEVIDVLPSVTRRAVVLSFYRPEYRPEHHRWTNIELDDSETIAHALDLAAGKSEVQGNFLTITIQGAA
jgi:hypothetical protein